MSEARSGSKQELVAMDTLSSDTDTIVDLPPAYTKAEASSKSKAGCMPKWFIITLIVGAVIGVILLIALSAVLVVGPLSLRSFSSCDSVQRSFTGFDGYIFYSPWRDWNLEKGCCDTLAMRNSSFCQMRMIEIAYMDAVPASRGTGSNSKEVQTSATEFSSTNNQVEDVDEPDIVKTDGEFVYTLSSRPSNSTSDAMCGSFLNIFSVLPTQNAALVSTTMLQGILPTDMFLINDTVVVLGMPRSTAYPEYEQVAIQVFNVTERSSPTLVRTVELEGRYVDARLANSTLRLVTYKDNTETPMVYDSAVSTTRIPTSPCTDMIGFNNVPASGFTIVSSMSLNEETIKTSPISHTTLVFTVSAIYANDEYLVLGAQVTSRSTSAVAVLQLNDTSATFQSIAKVPGQFKDQFSIDIYQDVVRVATTKGWSGDDGNNVYAYDIFTGEELGSITRLAVGETIRAVRFMQDRVYLVTFETKDPLFVIDVSDPANMVLLGELHIPGYSTYLHPLNSTHLVGVGRDTNEEGDDIGVKFSLFSVEDASAPIEVYNIKFGDSYSRSAVEDTHHAFLFVPHHNLMVIPLYLQKGSYDAPANRTQGAIVLRVGESGFEEEAFVSHFTSEEWTAAKRFADCSYDSAMEAQATSGFFVERSLYMDDYLVTVSQHRMVVTDMANADFPTITTVAVPGLETASNTSFRCDSEY
eukprot:m.280881 g.280881  ORF g.280881 m.280881 type:complete len:696 (-) comp15751_c1_seq3:106-2193(-)